MYIYIYIYTHTPTYLPTYLPACLPTYLRTCMHACIPTFLPTYLSACRPTYIHTLHYLTLHYITLHYITLHYITLHYILFHYTHTYIHTYIHTFIHAYIHTYILVCFAERLPQTLSDARSSTKGWVRADRVVARTRNKRCVRAHNGKKTRQPAARNLDCYCLGMPFQEAEGEAPHSLSATCKAQTNAITEEGAAAICRFHVLCVPMQLDGVSKGNRRNTERLEEPQRANGAKQRGANGRKSEKCRCCLLEGGYRRTPVLDCRSKGT